MDTPAPSPAVPEKRIGKFRASYLLAAESFELFRKDKEITWFVVWNALIVFAITILFFGGMMALFMSGMVTLPGDGEEFPLMFQIAGYAALFVYWVACAYVTTYYSIALVSVVAARLEGEDKGFNDGMQAASAHAGKIFGWSLLSSTVGLILQILADKASWIGKLLSFMGGVAWNVATFFIIPVLARENETVTSSVKRSSQVFVAAWGETLIMNFSLGLFFGALHILLIIGTMVAAYFLMQSALALIILFAVFFIVFVSLILIGTVLDQVFRVVLYEYATRGTVPDSFTPQLIMGALKKKEA